MFVIATSAGSFFFLKMVVDYRTANPKLKSNGLEVGRLTVVGLLAEKAVKLCRTKRVGASALSPEHLPDSVGMNLDGRRQNLEVKCHPDDKILAIAVVKAVRVKMGGLNLELVDSLVKVEMGGRRVGDHDIVYEVVDSSPVVSGFVSTELKCRHLYSQRGREVARTALRVQCCDELRWWQEQERGKYAGRVIVIAVFPDKHGDDFQLYGDIKLNNESRWRGLFGWPGSRYRVAPSHEVPAAVQPARPKAQAKAKPRAKAKALARDPVAAADVFLRRLESQGLQFRDLTVGRASVVEVKALLRAIGRDCTNAAKWSNRAKEKHSWLTDAELFQAERTYASSNRGVTRRKLGGCMPWFATRRACLQLLQDLAVV
jgi:hypothetical protein